MEYPSKVEHDEGSDDASNCSGMQRNIMGRRKSTDCAPGRVLRSGRKVKNVADVAVMGSPHESDSKLVPGKRKRRAMTTTERAPETMRVLRARTNVKNVVGVAARGLHEPGSSVVPGKRVLRARTNVKNPSHPASLFESPAQADEPKVESTEHSASLFESPSVNDYGTNGPQTVDTKQSKKKELEGIDIRIFRAK